MLSPATKHWLGNQCAFALWPALISSLTSLNDAWFFYAGNGKGCQPHSDYCGKARKAQQLGAYCYGISPLEKCSLQNIEKMYSNVLKKMAVAKEGTIPLYDSIRLIGEGSRQHSLDSLDHSSRRRFEKK